MENALDIGEKGGESGLSGPVVQKGKWGGRGATLSHLKKGIETQTKKLRDEGGKGKILERLGSMHGQVDKEKIGLYPFNGVFGKKRVGKEVKTPRKNRISTR